MKFKNLLEEEYYTYSMFVKSQILTIYKEFSKDELIVKYYTENRIQEIIKTVIIINFYLMDIISYHIFNYSDITEKTLFMKKFVKNIPIEKDKKYKIRKISLLTFEMMSYLEIITKPLVDILTELKEDDIYIEDLSTNLYELILEYHNASVIMEEILSLFKIKKERKLNISDTLLYKKLDKNIRYNEAKQKITDYFKR